MNDVEFTRVWIFGFSSGITFILLMVLLVNWLDSGIEKSKKESE